MEIYGYNLIRSDRNRNGGGIACYVKTSISFNYHRSPGENFENILIDIFYLNPNLSRLASFIDPLTSQASLMKTNIYLDLKTYLS